jgi:cell division protein FtsI (penicillin-binding protein 3)
MKSRLVVSIVILGLWGVAITARLVQLQVLDHDLYRDRAEGQQERRVELQAPRGMIFDSRGRKLAVSVEVDSVWADPSQIEDPTATADALARILSLDSQKLSQSLAMDREFIWVARQLDRPVAEAVRALGLEGVSFLKESKRYYPSRTLGASLIGFAGRDNKGLEGLEQGYDDVVSGQPVERKVLRDARRGTVLMPDISFREAEPGRDLHLTIDSWIQHLLERELAKVLEHTSANSVSGIVMDPNSGAILAMSSLPGFDPNRFGDFSRADWRNRVVMDAFEPGSTFKVITAAAALEANLVDPNDIVDCERGSVVVEGVRIKDHKSFDKLTFREVLAKSSNVGAIKTGLMVGRLGLYEQIDAFGFGKLSGVDLGGRRIIKIRQAEHWPRRATAYISFGQAISVTALQMANSFAAVANGGTLYQPYVVAGIGNNGSYEDLRPAPRVSGRPISASTARTLGRMLESVVEEGTARAAAIPGYRVAGKTGTAEKAVPSGGYVQGKYVASFVGFAPARRAEIVAMIAVDEPDPSVGYHGGGVAAPVFSAVVGPTLLYLGVPPDDEGDGLWPDEGLIAERAGTGESIQTNEDESEIVLASAAGALALEEGEVVPDLTGLTSRQAVVQLAEIGLRANLHGQGLVNRQSPPAGSRFGESSERLELWLANESGR